MCVLLCGVYAATTATIRDLDTVFSVWLVGFVCVYLMWFKNEFIRDARHD